MPVSAETEKYQAEREATMLERGFVSVSKAAELVKHPRSNIFHWVRDKKLGSEKWGDGKGSVFVSLADLQRKFPAAFGKVVTEKTRAPAGDLPPARRDARAAQAPTVKLLPGEKVSFKKPKKQRPGKWA